MEYESLEQQLVEIKIQFSDAVADFLSEQETLQAVANLENQEEIEFDALSDVSERRVEGNELDETFSNALATYRDKIQDNLILDDLYARYIELTHEFEDLN
ncbi:hypothetical protein SAMN02745116_01432 [Pilibacter termitis]|uniref:Uncharacterized protein n=2 Tax=Pilibacter termitis TaxID=263852 RepID=A0A1T4NIM2_9ENTE|nr:hypothetical protein SAMN02745116_01432 [Pilibacter termitis]